MGQVRTRLVAPGVRGVDDHGRDLPGRVVNIHSIHTGERHPFPKVATQRLITTGPYACTRNPMTLGAFLLYLGIAVGMGSMSVILLVLVIFTALLTFIYRHETRELTERFGGEYLEYRKKTSFLIPRCR
ncbi:MAG: isoprenylcysteine carboxylmethyltransferase family protein [Anaerolineaceae bacterium]|nr:isoprenylcysteine carboxylmethyltransferase family protein [Anaerolineaceae bacterium]